MWMGLVVCGIYTRSHPEDKMAAGLGIVMEEERGGRGLQGRKGLSGPHTETGSTALTEAPLLGLAHCFWNGRQWLITNTEALWPLPSLSLALR